MPSFESRFPENWDDGDRMTFALAGLNRVVAGALKESLGSVRGWTDDYPDRLLADIDHWRDIIAGLRASPEKELAAALRAHLILDENHEAGLIPMGTQAFLLGIADRLDPIKEE